MVSFSLRPVFWGVSWFPDFRSEIHISLLSSSKLRIGILYTKCNFSVSTYSTSYTRLLPIGKRFFHNPDIVKYIRRESNRIKKFESNKIENHESNQVENNEHQKC